METCNKDGNLRGLLVMITHPEGVHVDMEHNAHYTIPEGNNKSITCIMPRNNWLAS